MKYYLIFFIFILINSYCYDDDYITGLDKKVCFKRELQGNERSKDNGYSFGEAPDT